jgi:hypothetical protein
MPLKFNPISGEFDLVDVNPYITNGSAGISNIRMEASDLSLWDLTVDSTGALVTTNVPTGVIAAPTLLDGALYSPTGTCTSASISPTANSLLVITCATGVAAGTFAFSSTTLSGVGSWTLLGQVNDGNVRVGILYAKITGSPGTGTITITGFGSPGATRAVMHVMEVTNGTTMTNVQTGTQTSATPSLTLGATPATNSLVIGAIAHNSATTTAGTNFTELAEHNGNRGMQTQYDQTAATTSVPWTSSAISHAMIAGEVT